MHIDTRPIVSVTEANQDFSSETNIAEKTGQADLFMNNRPNRLSVDMEQSPAVDLTDDEKIDFAAARILKKHIKAFRELAK